MGSMINDDVFGQMEYRHRWVKKENLLFWGKEVELQIVAKAFSGQSIVDEQRNAYILFKKDIHHISEITERKVREYIREEVKDIGKEFGNETLYNLVSPVSVIFTKRGEVYILCDCTWDREEGIGIGIVPDYVVAPQDYFL